MSSFFEPALAELWAQTQAVHSEHLRLANEPETKDLSEPRFVPQEPFSRAQMVKAVPRRMAQAWLRRHELSTSLEDLRLELMAENPAWAHRMIVAYRCKRALEDMNDNQFHWRPTGRQADGEIQEPQDWPKPGQWVLYFFEVVGSHAGYFAGEEEGLDVFCGLFGGFLGGDVSHWMPMPGLEEEVLIEEAA